MGLPVTKLFCVSTAVRTVATSRPPIVTGANSCQAKPFSTLPALPDRKKCQLRPHFNPVTAATFITSVGQVMKAHVKGKLLIITRDIA